MIYHKSPKSYIEELALVTSKPTPNCPIEIQRGIIIYGYCCSYKILYEFVDLLTYGEMQANRVLSDWISSNRNLQGMYFPIDISIWNLIEDRIKEKNITYTGYKSLI